MIDLTRITDLDLCKLAVLEPDLLRQALAVAADTRIIDLCATLECTTSEAGKIGLRAHKVVHGETIIDEFFRDVDRQIADGSVRMLFWTCPMATHKGVTWSHDHEAGTSLAICDVCGRTNTPT
jgi:hypothetical protein